MVSFSNAGFPSSSNAFFTEKAFSYAELLLDTTTPERVLEIIKCPPLDFKRRQQVIDIGRDLVIRFHLAELPEWMGYSPDHFGFEYLFSTPEALLKELRKENPSPELLDALKGERCINEYGETAFHYACRWKHADRYELLKLLITHVYECCRFNDLGIHPFDLIEDSSEEPLVTLLEELPLPQVITDDHYCSVCGWMDVLIELDNLDYAISYARENPNRLLHINYTELEKIEQYRKFDDYLMKTPFTNLFQRELPQDKIRPFFEIWDNNSACFSGVGSEYLDLFKLDREILIDHVQNNTPCKILDKWLCMAKSVLSSSYHNNIQFFDAHFIYIIDLIFSCITGDPKHIPCNMLLVDTMINFVFLYELYSSRVYFHQLLEQYIQNQDVGDEIKAYFLTRYPFVYEQTQIYGNHHIVQKVYDSHDFNIFYSPEFLSMTEEAKIGYLELILPNYDNERQKLILETVCPLGAANDKLNRYFIEKGFPTVSLGSSIFMDANIEGLLSWFRSGGQLLKEYTTVEWNQSTCSIASILIEKSAYFKKHFRKYFNPYTGNPRTIGPHLLTLVLSSGQKIDQNFFYRYQNGILLNEIFKLQGYLLQDESLKHK